MEKVGKTDVIKMKIVLDSNAKPTCAPVRENKRSLQESLCKQIDSWLKDGVIMSAVSPWVVHWSLWPKRMGLLNEL